jgi:hypothetical protein
MQTQFGFPGPAGSRAYTPYGRCLPAPSYANHMIPPPALDTFNCPRAANRRGTKLEGARCVLGAASSGHCLDPLP